MAEVMAIFARIVTRMALFERLLICEYNLILVLVLLALFSIHVNAPVCF